MEKIKRFIKETNGLAIFSFLLAIFSWLLPFIFNGFDNGPNIFGGGAVLLGIFALVWIKIKKQKGNSLAIFGIVLGGLASITLISMC